MMDLRLKPDLPVRYAPKNALTFGRLNKGVLFHAYYDTETSGLDKRFSEILQFGGLITDIAGNLLHMADYRGRLSPYNVINPYAWMVQRLTAESFALGEPQYKLAGRMMQFFRHAHALHEAPHAQDFLKICRPGTFNLPDGTQETYHAYPLQNDDGSLDYNCVRIHENLKKLYVRHPASGAWLRKNITARAIGYNNVNADDQWMWTALHMAGASNIFITHLAQLGNSRLDALRCVEAAYLAGPKGENGIKPGLKKVGDQTIPTFSQGDVLAANTHLASELRGLREGLTQPDGSIPDLTQLHGAFADSFALAGLVRYMERETPDILTVMEANSDWKDVIERLTERKGGFGDHPIHAYIDKAYPYLTGGMVTLIGTDQNRHNPKMALLFNLDIDPETFRFRGNKLEDLTADDHASLIKNSRGYSNGIYKIVSAHKSPRLLPADMGFAAGFNNGLDLPELQARAKKLRKMKFTEAAMAGLRKAYPRLDGPECLMLPQLEEELFTFSTLEMQNADSGENVQVHLARTPLEKIAQDTRRHAVLVKSLWLKAIEADDDIILNDYKDDPAAERRDAAKFINKIATLNKKLEENSGPSLPPSDVKRVETAQDALAYKTKLLFFARNHFAMGSLKDLAHGFWFEDAQGHRIDDKDIAAWPQWRIDHAIKSGALNIVHEELNTTAPIIDRILESLGHADALGPEVREQLDAIKALRCRGIPDNGGRDRWYTFEQARLDVKKILNNELQDADLRALEHGLPGAWAMFAGRNHDSQKSLGDYMRYLDAQETKTSELTPYRQALAGIDIHIGRAAENILYEIDATNILELTVPDRYLENPPRDPVSRKPLWLVPSFNAASLGSKTIILKAQYTHRRKHLAKATAQAAPADGGLYEDFYKAVRARFAESGITFRGADAYTQLTGDGPYELHGERKIDLSLQTLHAPKRIFEGFLDHRLSGYAQTLNGLIVRDDALTAAPGPVRLLEAHPDTGKPTGWEFTADITGARRMTIADIESLPPQNYGAPTSDILIDKISTLFSDKKLDPTDPANTVWVIDLGRIDAGDPNRGIVYFNPAIRKFSALKPVPA